MNTIAQIFPRTGRISGPEVADGAKPDVPTTDVENEKKKKHRVFYEAVDAHARRRLKSVSWGGDLESNSVGVVGPCVKALSPLPPGILHSPQISLL